MSELQRYTFRDLYNRDMHSRYAQEFELHFVRNRPNVFAVLAICARNLNSNITANETMIYLFKLHTEIRKNKKSRRQNPSHNSDNKKSMAKNYITYQDYCKRDSKNDKNVDSAQDGAQRWPTLKEM